jgi:hypothetical protein
MLEGKQEETTRDGADMWPCPPGSGAGKNENNKPPHPQCPAGQCLRWRLLAMDGAELAGPVIAAVSGCQCAGGASGLQIAACGPDAAGWLAGWIDSSQLVVY